MADEKLRYTKEELQEFRDIILGKLEIAKGEFNGLKEGLKNDAANGGDSNKNLTFEDGAETFEKENLNQLAGRQLKFIQNLEGALVRIENGTYGVCRTSGQLIPKERLRAVPHTTQTIEAKLNRK
jgi:RNA polymerase-binding transcription factor DksA